MKKGSLSINGVSSRLSCFCSIIWLILQVIYFITQSLLPSNRLTFFIDRKRIVCSIFTNNLNQSKSKPDRSSFLFLLEIHVKWAITPVADTKCLHTVLNFTILKKLWASRHNVVRYNTPAWGNRLQCVILLLVVVWAKKLNFSTFYWF